MLKFKQTSKKGYGLKIAIIDDSWSVRMMISICLDELGIADEEVFEFPSAKEALKDFGKNYYDLIFCDLHMPEMDGHELVETVYKKYKHLNSSRLVMVSGEEDASYKERFKPFGVHQFIKKPIQPEAFLHHITPLVKKIERREA